MEFLREGDVPERPDGLLCREGSLVKGLWTLPTIVIADLLSLAPFLWNATLWVLVLALLMHLIGLFFYASFSASLRKSNWLLKADREGVWIKYRSYLNHDFPAQDKTVVFIPRGEILWFRAHRHRVLLPAMEPDEGVVREYRTYLELKLAHEDCEALRDALKAEWNREVPAFMGTKGKFRHQPLHLLDGGLLRLDWSAGGPSIQPRIRKTIQVLRRWYVINDPASSKDKDLTGPTPKEQEDKLLDLMERGDTMGAVRLARKLYGYSLTEAKVFLDELKGS